MFNNKVNSAYVGAAGLFGAVFIVLAVVDFAGGSSADGVQDLLYAALSFVAGAVLFALNRRDLQRRAATANARGGTR